MIERCRVDPRCLQDVKLRSKCGPLQENARNRQARSKLVLCGPAITATISHFFPPTKTNKKCPIKVTIYHRKQHNARPLSGALAS
ncbi:hypothetical protein RRG08_060962 [Elysia crispata]|uniref:Uncharacterized protein n=1 Tax=Elysia crispata TaxID=231223 RepID=A0AAE1AWT0_9GAST|nr:hypothetical protein RRG08_060962 [Elysia crispata]